MHIRKVFQHLLRLQGVRVTGVEFRVDAFHVHRRRRHRARPSVLAVPPRFAGGQPPRREGWLRRHLDLGPWEVYLRATVDRSVTSTAARS